MRTEPPEIVIPPFEVEEVMTTLSQSMDWGITKLNIPELWKKTKGEGITVAIIDTGFPGKPGKTHPDLVHNAVLDKSKSCVQGETVYDTGVGHGTMCCGIVAGEDNEIGYVGYAPKAKLICIKALSNNGSGGLSNIESALEYAVSIKPDIVSMSLGAKRSTNRIHELIQQLDDMNIPVVVAAGNGGASEGVLYPAKYEEVFSIAAYDRNEKIATFSAVGPEVDFAFPGVSITSTYLNDGYATMNGTSFACPACAGVIALILSAHKKAVAEGLEEEYQTTWDIYNILKKYSSNPNTNGEKDTHFGWGIVDVSCMETKAVYVENLKNADTLWNRIKKALNKLLFWKRSSK